MNRIVLAVLALSLVVLIAVRQFGGGTEGLDPKGALDASIKQVREQRQLSERDEIRLRIELAWGDFMARNGRIPKSINDLVPTYFDSVPIDPATGQAFKYPSDEDVTADAGVQTASLSSDPVESIFADGAFVNPNTMKESEFVYDPTGKRDPFAPFDFSGGYEIDTNLPPLERYTIGQLKVSAILKETRDGSFYAFIEDATGVGHPARKGTRVGNENGIVVRITEDAVFVVETKTDITGKTSRNTVEMKLQRGQPEDKNARYQRIRNTDGGGAQRRRR